MMEHREIVPMGPGPERPVVNRALVAERMMLREGSHSARGAYRRARRRWQQQMREMRPKTVTRRAWNRLAGRV